LVFAIATLTIRRPLLVVSLIFLVLTDTAAPVSSVAAAVPADFLRPDNTAAPVPSVAAAVPANFPGADDTAAAVLRPVAAAIPATTQSDDGLETQGFIYEQPTQAY
jgi:hypothetical protein